MAKACLYLTVKVDGIPLSILNADIREKRDGDLAIVIPGPGERVWELLMAEDESLEAAEQKLLRMVRGEEFCPAGDLRTLRPLLDPKFPAATQREFEQKVHEGAGKLPYNPHVPIRMPGWTGE